MIYDLHNDLDRTRFEQNFRILLERGGVVEMTEKRPQRSLQQNRYLHLLLGEFAIQTGNTVEYVKRAYFKALCNADIFAVEKMDKWAGKVVELRSTADLTTAEMTTAIERFRNWSSSEAGIYLPAPNETEWLHSIEIEMQRQKQWL
mgnify:CR=1 FL=1